MKSTFLLPEKYRNWTWVLMVIGLLAIAGGFATAPTDVWISLHVSCLFFLTASLFGGFILAVAEVSGGAWLSPYKSVAEAMTAFLIPGGVLLLITFLGGGHTLFQWTQVPAHHQAYLNTPFFIARLLFFISLWVVLSQKLISVSRKQLDTRGKWAVAFLIVFAFTFSFSSFDWIMSIESHWVSTIFAVYCFTGFFVAGMAVLTIAVVTLDHYGQLSSGINENHYHDLGKFLFGFSTFWAYIWLSQFLLIWYTNIPEETVYYSLRLENDWDWLFYFNLVLNWIIPFFVLLPRGAKRSREVLLRVAVVLLVGRWLDLFIMVAPKIFQESKVLGPSIGWIEVGTALGMGGLFVWICGIYLGKNRMIPIEDTYFEEGLHLTQ